MATNGRIITVGLTPAWDMCCKVSGLDWGGHETVNSYTKIPAGKSLNISKALAYLGCKSIAAGFWGSDDYALMQQQLSFCSDKLDIRITAVDGSTRTNITVEDTLHNRHFHLRFSDELCSASNLQKLSSDLSEIIRPDDICVFAGSLRRTEFLPQTLTLLKACISAGASIVLDTNGAGFSSVVSACRISVISPNLSELCQLLGRSVPDQPSAIVSACNQLLDKVELILVSRGKSGAMLISRDKSYSCSLSGSSGKVCREVGCGDNFLAGFLSVYNTDRAALSSALSTGVKLASAYAFGLTSSSDSDTALSQIDTVLTEL